MSLVVVTPPQPVLTAADVRRHLRLDGTQDDDFLDDLIATATAEIDRQGHEAIGAQRLEQREPDFGCGQIRLWPPVRAVVSVSYLDAAGTERTVATADWHAVNRFLFIRSGWAPVSLADRSDAVRIVYEAGYVADRIPTPIKHAVVLGVRELITTGAQDPALRSETVDGVASRTWTISQDTTGPLRQTMDRLLAPYRVFA